MHRIAALVVVAGCFSKPDPPGAGGGDARLDDGRVGDSPPPGAKWLDGYTYRRPVVITRISATTTLADFPVSVVFGDADLAAHTMGADVVFTAEDGATVLASEVESPQTTLEAWVRVPSLGPSTTTLFVYYGGAVVPENPVAVWPGFAGVWHMNTPRAEEIDTTGTVPPVMSPDTTFMPDYVAGLVGYARQFDGVDDYMCTGNSGLSVDTSSISYSVWVNVDGLASSVGSPLYRGGDLSTNHGFTLDLGGSPWTSSISDGAVKMTVTLSNRRTGWTQVAMVIDRGSGMAYGYIDGVHVIQNVLGTFGSLDPGPNFCLSNPAKPFDGVLDEVRIYKTVKSAEWFAAEYFNLMQRASFVSVGAEQTR